MFPEIRRRSSLRGRAMQEDFLEPERRTGDPLGDVCILISTMAGGATLGAVTADGIGAVLGALLGVAAGIFSWRGRRAA